MLHNYTIIGGNGDFYLVIFYLFIYFCLKKDWIQFTVSWKRAIMRRRRRGMIM